MGGFNTEELYPMDMSKGSDFKRRSFLNHLGAAGSASTLGMTSKVTASEVQSADASHLRLSDRIHSIIEAVPRLRLNYNRAEKVEFQNANGETILNVIEIQSNFGKLIVGDLPKTDYHEVIFNFKNRRPRMEFDVPEEADAVLFGRPDEAVLFREPTSAEMEKLRETIGKQDEELHAYTHSSISGFKIVDSNKEKNKMEYFKVESEASDGYSVASAAKGEFEVTNSEIIDTEKQKQEASTYANCSKDYFALSAYLCAQNIAICGLCGSVCVSSLLGNYAGAVACFVCIGSTCGLTTLPPIGSCYTVADCIGEYTDDVSFDI
mgnify:FL=1